MFNFWADLEYVFLTNEWSVINYAQLSFIQTLNTITCLIRLEDIFEHLQYEQIIRYVEFSNEQYVICEDV